jgi:purine-binding chemotaxis protein CheW
LEVKDAMQQLLVWNLDQQRYALPFDVVERVVRVVAVTQLPDAPDIVCGIINVKGQVVPVINVRRRFGLPQRDMQLSDQLVIANMRARRVAILVDAVSVVITQADEEVVPAETIVPGLGCIAGITKLHDGMILIHDLDRCLSLDQMSALDDSLHALGRRLQ